MLRYMLKKVRIETIGLQYGISGHQLYRLSSFWAKLQYYE